MYYLVYLSLYLARGPPVDIDTAVFGANGKHISSWTELNIRDGTFRVADNWFNLDRFRITNVDNQYKTLRQ